MRARESGAKRPCEAPGCTATTLFQAELRGPKGGHLRYADLCVLHGEQTAIVEALAAAARKAVAA